MNFINNSNNNNNKNTHHNVAVAINPQLLEIHTQLKMKRKKLENRHCVLSARASTWAWYFQFQLFFCFTCEMLSNTQRMNDNIQKMHTKKLLFNREGKTAVGEKWAWNFWRAFDVFMIMIITVISLRQKKMERKAHKNSQLVVEQNTV